MTYFDNAATTYPKPDRVNRAVRQAMERYGANPGRSGHKMSMDTAVNIYEVRELAAKLFGADKEEDVVFTLNCTHSINLALKGMLHPGDHVIISDLEHNAVLRPVHTLSERGMITYSIARVAEDDEETVANFRALIRPKTRLIACTHGSNVFGIRLPIERIGALAAESDLLFLVDAAQTAGVLEIDMRKSHIDFLCMPGHKGLYGPMGTGILITPLGSALDTVVEGGTGTLSAIYSQPFDMPERLESGTLNAPGIIALGEGIRYVAETGLPTIHAHETKVTDALARRLREIPNVTVYSAFSVPGGRLPLLSFNVEGLNSEIAAGRLSDAGFALRGGLHCAPLAHKKFGTLDSGTVRASVGVYNTTKQAEALAAAVKRLGLEDAEKNRRGGKR